MKSHLIRPIEDVFADRIRSISKITWVAFLVTMMMAVIVNFPAFSLRLQGPDGIIADPLLIWYFDFQLGKWMVPLDAYLCNWLNISYYLCAVSFFVMGLISVLLCKAFKVKRPLTALVISILIAVFPSFSSGMQVFYFSVSFFSSIFCALLGIWLCWEKHNVLAGSVSLCIGLGFYQTGIAVAATFCILILIWQLFEKEVPLKEIRSTAVRMLVTGGLGVLFYFIVLKLLSGILNIPLAIGSYSGIGALTDWHIWPLLIVKVFKAAGAFYLQGEAFNNGSWGFNIFNIAILGTGIFFLCVKAKHCGFLRIALAVCLISILPIFMGLIEIIFPDRTLDWLQTFPFLLPLVFSIALASDVILHCTQKSFYRGIQCFLIIVVILLANRYWQYDTANYLAMELTQNKTEALARRLVDDMEDTDGYVPGMKVLFCGTENPDNYPQIHNALYAATNLSSSRNGMVWPDISAAQMEWSAIMQRFTGIAYQQCDWNDIQRILTSEIYPEIPLYPDKQSLHIVDGIMVIKLSDAYG